MIRLLALLLLVFPTLASAEKRSSGESPNVILIMADDMGFECVRANGGETYDTPRLDELAATGIRFEHCHAQPICTPSRVQIMTGIYNHRNYLRFGVLDPEAKTFGHLFRKAGYRTVVAGKWQLDGGFGGPNRFGFDEYCLWQLTRLPPRFPNPGFEINGKAVDFRNGEYGPDIASDYLCDFIERNQDEKFFVYYPMIPPHFPFQPTPDSEEWNPKESREYPRKEWRDEWFQDMVAYTDKVVGKIVDKLEALGLRENTLIIFTGDNGTYAGLKSQFKGEIYVGGKGGTKDNGTHVPLIVNWPGTTPEGVVSRSLVDLSDMLPTIAEIAGIPVPKKWGIDGVSFASEIRGGEKSPREWIYCWYHRDGIRDEASEHVRDQYFKLYGDGRFYNVADDFSEKNAIPKDALAGSDLETFRKLDAALQVKLAETDEADPIQAAKRQRIQREPKKNTKNTADKKKPKKEDNRKESIE
jgi:arylsulfatase A